MRFCTRKEKVHLMEIQTTPNFSDMGLGAATLRAIEDLGYEEATPIQSQAIELIMRGHDVLGQSQTGTGKTAAFGIPILERINPEDRRLQAVILCPTRELAIQVSEEFRKLLKYRDNIRVLPIYGGQPIDRQIIALKKGVQVVIGTPGRVMDHMNRRTLRMDSVRAVVLDEADEMLDMGFREDIEFILERMSEERQTIMFSATMPREILDLAERFFDDPIQIKTVHREMTVPNIEQIYFEVKEHSKPEALCRLIDLHNPQLALVFCNTKKRVDELVEQLQSRGYFAEALHGDLKQPQRDMVMKKFRNKTIDILVATDVAARGIDVSEIDMVFNYDVPQDEEYYVHRIGRTARAGKSGVAFTFVVGREIYKLRDIMRYTKSKIEHSRLPALADIEEVRIKAFIEQVIASLEDGKLTKYVNLVNEMTANDEYTATDIAAALLKMNLFDANAVDEDLNEPVREPRREKGIDREGGNRGNGKYSSEGMERLFINIGKKDKLTVPELLNILITHSGIQKRIIGNIDLYDEFSFVDIPKEHIKHVSNMIKGKKYKGKKINVEKAKRK